MCSEQLHVDESLSGGVRRIWKGKHCKRAETEIKRKKLARAAAIPPLCN